MNEIQPNQSKFLSARLLGIAEIILIVALASVPLFVTFPYRVNIFLSWEGAYRMSNGEMPFRDFGLPMGGMYWIIPAIFFKIFGTQMITLVKAQVFINIISGLAFRSILKSLNVQSGIRFISVMLFCLSYSFFNFWPWYNHTVIVYEFIGLAFLFKYLTATRQDKMNWFWLAAAALFTTFSFMTKQDGGGMAFMISAALMLWYAIAEKKWLALFAYIGMFAAFTFIIIYPFLKYDFGYWFNHGQPPHTARISFFEIADELMSGSMWLKFYIVLIFLLVIFHYKNVREFWNDKRQFLFFLLTIFILGEAAIFQVTSYTPPDNNIFYHSFAIAFIISFVAEKYKINYSKLVPFLATVLAILFWWSHVYWMYMQRILERAFPQSYAKVSATGENLVNKRTYLINQDTTEIPLTEWKFSSLPVFNKIYMPEKTVQGIDRLLASDLVKNNKNLKVLNMSELTPLAAVLPYQLEKGADIPLWYHLGVGMFNRDAAMFEKKISEKKYDLVLFEYVPSLNNFYPFRVRDSLQVHYQKIDSFPAPRRGNTTGFIEVYVK